jgi:CheY-like chemotaxis protein
VLEREKWIVAEAADGHEGLARISERKPAPPILLDLMMPEMDGFEFPVALRRNPERRDIPIVVLTAKDLAPDDRAPPQRSCGGDSRQGRLHAGGTAGRADTRSAKLPVGLNCQQKRSSASKTA